MIPKISNWMEKIWIPFFAEASLLRPFWKGGVLPSLETYNLNICQDLLSQAEIEDIFHLQCAPWVIPFAMKMWVPLQIWTFPRWTFTSFQHWFPFHQKKWFLCPSETYSKFIKWKKNSWWSSQIQVQHTTEDMCFLSFRNLLKNIQTKKFAPLNDVLSQQFTEDLFFLSFRNLSAQNSTESCQLSGWPVSGSQCDTGNHPITLHFLLLYKSLETEDMITCCTKWVIPNVSEPSEFPLTD